MPAMRSAVSSERAPQALGPYSQAIVAGGFVFCSGMAGIDPATGAVPDGIEAQTEQALSNLDAVLAAAGASMDDVVKTTVFYAKDGRTIAYGVVEGDGLPRPPGAEGTSTDGVLYQTARIDGRLVVTWRRLGHTCVLVGDAPQAELLTLASYKV